MKTLFSDFTFAGNITMDDVLSVQPFRNTVDVIELTGQTILDAFEYSASRRVETGSLFGGFLQVSGMSTSRKKLLL